tara:strand:- start:3968 stop:4132 length:165 start_codon:yes stop_codon:yes gene_type:complete
MSIGDFEKAINKRDKAYRALMETGLELILHPDMPRPLNLELIQYGVDERKKVKE